MKVNAVSVLVSRHGILSHWGTGDIGGQQLTLKMGNGSNTYTVLYVNVTYLIVSVSPYTQTVVDNGLLSMTETIQRVVQSGLYH